MVEFVIRPDDVRRATRELNANRGAYAETDSVDILVSECVATFRAVGTEAEVPVNGTCPGTVRIPLRVWDDLERVCRTLGKKELKFTCEPGLVRVGSWTSKHPDIELGLVPDQRFSVPVDISVLDTLALGRILTPEQVIEQDMRARLEEAEKIRVRAIASALVALHPLGITEKQLIDLTDEHLNSAAANLRRVLQMGPLP